MIYQLYTCAIPYVGVPDKQVAALVLKGTRPERPSTPGNDSEPMVDDLWNIVQQCWDADATKRPVAHTLVESIAAYVNGGNEIILNDDPEAPVINDEPEHMSTSRSDSPDTVTSEFSAQPDTPIDSPHVDVHTAVHPRSVEDYKSVERTDTRKSGKTITLNEIPPPPYARVDPSIRVALAIPPSAPVLEKTMVASPTSGPEETRNTIETSTEAASSSTTTNNDPPNTMIEDSVPAASQTVHEPTQESTTSDDVHEARGKQTVNRCRSRAAHLATQLRRCFMTRNKSTISKSKLR